MSHGVSKSSFTKVSSLSYPLNLPFLSTVYSSEVTTLHAVIQTGNVGVILDFFLVDPYLKIVIMINIMIFM